VLEWNRQWSMSRMKSKKKKKLISASGLEKESEF